MLKRLESGSEKMNLQNCPKRVKRHFSGTDFELSKFCDLFLLVVYVRMEKCSDLQLCTFVNSLSNKLQITTHVPILSDTFAVISTQRIKTFVI